MPLKHYYFAEKAAAACAASALKYFAPHFAVYTELGIGPVVSCVRHCIISQPMEVPLLFVGVHFLRLAVYVAFVGCAAPPQSHIAPFCPQQSCCGLFCGFRACQTVSAISLYNYR